MIDLDMEHMAQLQRLQLLRCPILIFNFEIDEAKRSVVCTFQRVCRR